MIEREYGVDVTARLYDMHRERIDIR